MMYFLQYYSLFYENWKLYLISSQVPLLKQWSDETGSILKPPRHLLDFQVMFNKLNKQFFIYFS